MTKHKTGAREEWLKARLELLEHEKELTLRSDELAQRRKELPWVPISKGYRFETDEGTAALADLFNGRFTPLGLPLYIRARLGGWLPLLLLDRRRLQRNSSPLG